jgi:hypothetical protein
MGDITQLITAIAALVTALGGASAAVIVAIRSGNTQAKVASSRGANMIQAAEGGQSGNTEDTVAVFRNMDPQEMAAVYDLLGKIPGAMPSSPPSQDPPP